MLPYLLVLCCLFSLNLWAQKSKEPEMLVPYRIGDNWGYSNAKGDLRIPVRFEEVDFFLQDLAKVKLGGLWGLIDRKGNQFLPCAYNIVYGAGKQTRVVVCKGGDKNGHMGKWGFVPTYLPNETNLELEYDLIRECGGEGLLGVLKNGKWGAIDGRGKWRIPAEFDVQNPAHHTLNFDNQLIISLPTENAPDNPYLKLRFANRLARVSQNGKWGFLNESGVAIVPLQYEFVGEFAEGLVAVVGKTQAGFRLGFVNNQNDTIVPLQYDVREGVYQKTQFQQGLALVGQAGKLGYINTAGKAVVPFQYAQAHPFNEGRAWVSEDYSMQPVWKMINEQNEVIFSLPTDCQLLDTEFQQGFVRIRQGDKENYLSRKGTWLLAVWAKRLEPFSNGLGGAVVQVGEQLKLGYLDEKGDWAIEPRYDYTPNTANAQRVGEFIKLRLVGKYGILNHKGRVIVPFEFDGLELPFYLSQGELFGREKRLPASLQGKWGYLNEKGDWAIEPQYEQTRFFANGFAKVKYEGKWGYINTQNKRFWR